MRRATASEPLPMKRVLLALLLAGCGGNEGIAVYATLEQSLSGEVQALQVAFLSRPATHDCRFILGNGCLAAQSKPLVELADGSRAARLELALTAEAKDVTVEGIPIGKYMLVVEALGEGDKLLGNACEPLVEVRDTNQPLKITVKSWRGAACTATLP